MKIDLKQIYSGSLDVEGGEKYETRLYMGTRFNSIEKREYDSMDGSMGCSPCGFARWQMELLHSSLAYVESRIPS